MSLLNSVLSSINGGQSAPPRSQSVPSLPQSKPPPRNTVTAPAPPKRKAEDVAGDVKPKAARVESASSRLKPNTALAPPPSRSTTTSPAQNASLPPPKAPLPYRGSGPAAKAQSSAKPPTISTSTSSAQRPSTISNTPSSASAPAKGGYLATLQRAKELAEASKQAGQIKHKPVEKLTKKDRLRLIEEARKGKPAAAKDGKAAAKGGRGKSAEPVDPKTGASIRQRKPIEVAYKGTMRAAPAAPAYRGTMGGPGGAAARQPLSAPASNKSNYSTGRRYASYSDEEDDEDDGEENDYESESDMEAGMDQVYEEEEASRRIAQREDAEALREENELKRQKLERKRKLDELAAKQKRRF